ncbi:MAG: 3-deoxy-manno-octulosonate cytidylyltransferase [Gammaproteobacteria bacterium]|nr:3-deoxy-manno-octulosonate cytidylyltransferase [Gammaproteobacteria bacterium]
MRFMVLIPARYASQRLPGKPLAELLGRPLILHVCERARESGAEHVVVATDDARIHDVCSAAGVAVEMTGAGHASGTDRIAEVVTRLNWDDAEIVVNLQGDEPLMPAANIRQVAQLLDAREDAQLATLCTPIHALEDYLNPNVVKLVSDQAGNALYFSRAPIPWNREGANAGLASQQRWQDALRHVGLYAYRARALRQLAAAPPCGLEQLEMLEQLRALWLGMRIVVDVARETPGPSVDTPEDLYRVAALLRN